MNSPRALYPYYERRAPDRQTIADIFAGHWRAQLPEGVASGEADLFADRRPGWAAARLQGGLAGKRIVEFGPFEGYQTLLLERLGADNLISIEANSVNFLKCLCLKEMYGLKARFALGDAVAWLSAGEDVCDMIWASGLLYHLTDPIAFLDRLGRRTRAVYLWTHFYDWSVIGADATQARHFKPQSDVAATVSGHRLLLRARAYQIGADYAASLPVRWQGGAEAHALWLEKDDLLFLLREAGFAKITIAGISSTKSLPTISLLAEKA